MTVSSEPVGVVGPLHGLAEGLDLLADEDRAAHAEGAGLRDGLDRILERGDGGVGVVRLDGGGGGRAGLTDLGRDGRVDAPSVPAALDGGQDLAQEGGRVGLGGGARLVALRQCRPAEKGEGERARDGARAARVIPIVRAGKVIPVICFSSKVARRSPSTSGTRMMGLAAGRACLVHVPTRGARIRSEYRMKAGDDKTLARSCRCGGGVASRFRRRERSASFSSPLPSGRGLGLGGSPTPDRRAPHPPHPPFGHPGSESGAGSSPPRGEGDKDTAVHTRLDAHGTAAE